MFPDEDNKTVNRINILQDMIYRSERERLPLIDRAEGAAVPWTVPGHPDQKACRFAGRPDRTLFEAVITA